MQKRAGRALDEVLGVVRGAVQCAGRELRITYLPVNQIGLGAILGPEEKWGDGCVFIVIHCAVM